MLKKYKVVRSGRHAETLYFDNYDSVIEWADNSDMLYAELYILNGETYELLEDL